MSITHSLNGPEMTVLLAGLGVVVNACTLLFIQRKYSAKYPASTDK